MPLATSTAQGDRAGPWGWANARAKRAGQPSLGALEIACYTDLLGSDVGIEETSGPYTLLSPLPEYDIPYRPGLARMRLVLRVEQFLARDPDEYLDEGWQQLDPAVYHGGNADQELAALLSLALGIRLRSVGIARVFHHTDQDARGWPHETLPPPYLPRREPTPMLPYVDDPSRVDASRVRLLDSYANMSAGQASALVKSARAYQEAIWIADAEPRLAWLRLVTAVEAVAQQVPDQPAAARLQDADPELAERAIRTGDQQLIEMITRKVADQTGATRKFRNFLGGVEPPPRRPRSDRLDWRTLRRQLNTIYGYRSKDLHEGVPIPQPMCQPPYRPDRGYASEVALVPPGWRGFVPMQLHIFEYIVRSALLSWWESAPGVEAAAPADPQ